MSWVDYKVFTYLFLGPRYMDRIKALVGGLEDRDYYPYLQKILEVTEKENYDKIATEFTSCFINDFKHVKCPPYESWYVEKTVFGLSAQRVLEEYLKYGIIPKKQMPDHISTEMEFVSFLLYIHDEKNANTFILKHILNWVPRLADDIIRYSKGEYTRLIGETIKIFTESEKKRILSTAEMKES